MRVLSERPEAQRMMLKLANDYDELADRAEDRATRDRTPDPEGQIRGNEGVGVYIIVIRSG